MTTTAVRPGTTVLTLGFDGDKLPRAIELRERLSRVPVAAVRLAEPVDFAALPDIVLVRAIATIRECSSIGARVIWSLILGVDQLSLVPQLHHLPGPGTIAVPGASTPLADEWRSSSKFGLLYFRKGPQFLSVTDRRSGSSQQIILDDPVTTDVFLHALEGCPWAEVTRTPQSEAAARDLVNKELLLRIGDQCVTLPVHMRSWPIGTVLLGGTLASAGKKPGDVGEA